LIFLGQDRYTAVSKLYVKGALGCIIVSDITNPDSLTAALKWKEVIEENADLVDGKMIPIILLQNKTDLLENQGKREEYQKMEYLKEFADKHKFVNSYQVSAKSNSQLDASVETLLKEILKLNLFEASKDAFSKSVKPNDSVHGVKLLNKKDNQQTEKKKKCLCE
jgi:GTPase SAR1 family protein